MSNKQVGNIAVRDSYVYRGSPFSAMHVNNGVLESLFTEAKVELVTKASGEVEKATAEFRQQGGGNKGRPIRYEIEPDQIDIYYSFPPQPINELEKHLQVTESEHKAVLDALVTAYGRTTVPEIYARRWYGAAEGVPCVGWLKKQLAMQSADLSTEKFLQPGWTADMRLVNASVAFHAIPSSASSLPVELRRKLESISGFEVSVGSSASWEEGVATVSVTLRDLNPGFFIAILKSLT